MSRSLFSFLSDESAKCLETKCSMKMDNVFEENLFIHLAEYLKISVVGVGQDPGSEIEKVENLIHCGSEVHLRKFLVRARVSSSFVPGPARVSLVAGNVCPPCVPLEQSLDGLQGVYSPLPLDEGFGFQTNEPVDVQPYAPFLSLEVEPTPPLLETVQQAEPEAEQVELSPPALDAGTVPHPTDEAQEQVVEFSPPALDAGTVPLSTDEAQEQVVDEPSLAPVSAPVMDEPRPAPVSAPVMDVYTQFDRVYEGMKRFAQASVDTFLEDVEGVLTGQRTGGVYEECQTALRMMFVVSVLILLIFGFVLFVGACLSFCMQALLCVDMAWVTDVAQVIRNATAGNAACVSDVIQTLHNAAIVQTVRAIDMIQVLRNATVWTDASPPSPEPSVRKGGDLVRYAVPFGGPVLPSMRRRRNQELAMNMSRAPTLSWLHSSLSLAGSPRDATLALLHRFEELDARVARLENDVESMKKVRFIQACPAPSGSSAHADEIRALRQQVEGLERRLNTVDGILFVAVGVSLSLHALRMRGSAVGGLHWLLRWTGLTYFFGGSGAPAAV